MLIRRNRSTVDVHPEQGTRLQREEFLEPLVRRGVEIGESEHEVVGFCLVGGGDIGRWLGEGVGEGAEGGEVRGDGDGVDVTWSAVVQGERVGGRLKRFLLRGFGGV